MSFLSPIEKMMDTWFALLPRPTPKMEAADHACLIAHRGAFDKTLNIIENTQAAFQHALQLNCWGIEFDIHACADKTLIVNHDSDLQRLWGHSRPIRDLNFSQLRRIAPLIPSLAEVVTTFGKHLHLFIELKSPFIAFDSLVETLQSLSPCHDYHLLTLNSHILPKLADYFPKECLLLVPVHNNVNEFFKLTLQQSYGGVLGHYFLLGNKKVEELKKADQIAGVGFVNSKYSLYRELNRGLQFLFSNNTAAISRELGELRKIK